MLKQYKTITLIGLATLLSACGSNNTSSDNSLYKWGKGDYTNSLYNSMIQESDPQEALPKLEALSAEGKVAPGLYAQIGYLYYQQGNMAKAQAAFSQEMKHFPESKQYMEFLLNKGKPIEKAKVSSSQGKKKGAK